MDKALVLGTKDCRFESCQGHGTSLVLHARVVLQSGVTWRSAAFKRTHRGARTHDHKVKGLALCRLS